MPEIEIYYAQMCGLCHEAMDYLSGRGLEFSSYELKWDAEEGRFKGEHAEEFYKRCGDVDYVPQLFINGRHIKGWKTLSALIESGEIDDILSGPNNSSS